jgi:hypothetical protein
MHIPQRLLGRKDEHRALLVWTLVLLWSRFVSPGRGTRLCITGLV